MEAQGEVREEVERGEARESMLAPAAAATAVGLRGSSHLLWPVDGW